MTSRVSQWRRSRARLELVVTPEERALLQLVAEENHGTVSAVIREAVNEFVADVLERGVTQARARRDRGTAAP